MDASVDDEASAATRTEFWNARQGAVKILVDRAKERDELPEFVRSRQLIEVFIAPIHFRLLLTREAIDETFPTELASIAVSGGSAQQSL